MGFDTQVGSQYSIIAGGVFLFNLIVGIGAVTMPVGFEAAGVGFSSIILLITAFFSYMTATWVVESLSIANALYICEKEEEQNRELSSTINSYASEKSPLLFVNQQYLHNAIMSSKDNEKTGETYENEKSSSSSSITSTSISSFPIPLTNHIPYADEYKRRTRLNSQQNAPHFSSHHSDSDQEEHDRLLSDDQDDEFVPLLPEKDGYVQNPNAVYSRAFDWWYVPTYKESCFEINRRFEFGTMSELFFGIWMQRFFYLILAIYLFGDLAIYAVSVPSSMAQVTGGWGGMSQYSVYYLYLAFFAAVAIPFCFFNFQKTSVYQISTAIFRNLSILTMIVLAFIFIGNGKGADPAEVNVFNIAGFPKLFGGAIYAFMCHHSLPSLLTPIRQKQYLTPLIFCVMSFVWCLYNVLDYSAIFAFSQQTNLDCSKSTTNWACNLQGLYPLNFANYPIHWIGVILALYPVFTVSGNYVLIAITLRNNLQQLFMDTGPFSADSKYQCLYKHQRLLWASVASMPAFLVAFATRQASLLVSITGSYAGLFIMLFFPAMLVLKGRKIIAQHPQLSQTWNCHQSPFQNRYWAYFVLVLATSLFLYTLGNDIYSLSTS